MQELNESCKEELQKVFSSEESPVDDAAIISIDALGVDVRIRAGAEFGVLRMAFDTVSEANMCKRGTWIRAIIILNNIGYVLLY